MGVMGQTVGEKPAYGERGPWSLPQTIDLHRTVKKVLKVKERATGEDNW